MSPAYTARIVTGDGTMVQGPWSFTAKLAGAGLLIALADMLAFQGWFGRALPIVALSEATLETVLGALLDNSRQAGAFEVTIKVETGDMVRIVLADDGPGIPAADHDRVFEPFFTTRRAANGTGLGLSIVRSLLATAGGGIALEPSVAGARFVVTIPVGDYTGIAF